MPTTRARPTLRTLILLTTGLLLAPAITAQAGAANPPPPPALGEAATKALCARYTEAEHWVQKAVILLSLNHHWHPAGSAMILDAVQSKDERLNAFGIEALLRSDADLLPQIASVELLDELIARQVGDRNDLYGKRVSEALTRLAPKAGATGKSEWSRWWSTAKATFTPEPWQPSEQPVADGDTSAAVAQRAFDLYDNGLDMMICIDSTGSMQATIDALGSALGEMVDILDGISPKLRLGIVHYKDYGELGKTGAKVVQPFSKNIKTARKNLEKLRAYGGGDLPEAVFGGLELALDRKMNWKDDANKIVILIGDAPPHAADQDKTLALVKGACEDPGAVAGKPTTGPKATEQPKPFLTSAIGVFLEATGDLRNHPDYPKLVESQKQMREDFGAIAKAGGGVFVEVEFQIGGPPPTSKDKEKNRQKGDAIAGKATRAIVEHILVLSFGERFAREMRDFVHIFFDYREAEFIK